jgi:hypothetical protein
LSAAGIAFERADNAFLSIADPQAAQDLADGLDAHALHEHLDRWTRRFCPVLRQFPAGYHWSLMQVELATDVVFHNQTKFQPLYAAIVQAQRQVRVQARSAALEASTACTTCAP